MLRYHSPKPLVRWFKRSRKINPTLLGCIMRKPNSYSWDADCSFLPWLCNLQTSSSDLPYVLEFSLSLMSIFLLFLSGNILMQIIFSSSLYYLYQLQLLKVWTLATINIRILISHFMAQVGEITFNATTAPTKRVACISKSISCKACG